MACKAGQLLENRLLRLHLLEPCPLHLPRHPLWDFHLLEINGCPRLLRESPSRPPPILSFGTGPFWDSPCPKTVLKAGCPPPWPVVTFVLSPLERLNRRAVAFASRTGVSRPPPVGCPPRSSCCVLWCCDATRGGLWSTGGFGSTPRFSDCRCRSTIDEVVPCCEHRFDHRPDLQCQFLEKRIPTCWALAARFPCSFLRS
jgi:hypothetical protein